MREEVVAEVAAVVRALLEGDEAAAHRWSIRATWSTVREQEAGLNMATAGIRALVREWGRGLLALKQGDDWDWAFANGIRLDA